MLINNEFTKSHFQMSKDNKSKKKERVLLALERRKERQPLTWGVKKETEPYLKLQLVKSFE